jgi:hydroxypyruvate isomerase
MCTASAEVPRDAAGESTTLRRPSARGVSRRDMLGALVAAAGAIAAANPAGAIAASVAKAAAASGRLKQSVCRWPYDKIPLPEFCRRAKQLGLVAIDLLYADEWAVANEAGLTVSMGYASRRDHFIQTGFNDPANHALLIGELEAALPLAAKAKVANLIAMFGNRTAGIDDNTAIANCVAGLKKVAPLAERHGVTICVELLNSKVDHAGYQGDHTAFGAAVMQGVDSPRVKLLYDIYHMQIMEGDVIRTIRDNIQWIGHFHSGGVPGRHEIDGTQELNYHAVSTAIADLGFTGYLAHEFVPSRPDPFESLADAVRTCDV